jgi:superfamily II DNA/RNA helicase
MEQMDRERALIRFRNGTHRLLLATDLAARGIDVPEIRFILHYQLPAKAHEFVHRNGRTARMHQHGAAYVLHWRGEELPEYLEPLEEMPVTAAPVPSPSPWKTLYLSGGRKDKISKGDIAGLFQKQGGLKPDQLGLIEVKEEVAFVAVAASELNRLLPLVDNTRLKTKKVRVTVLE